MMYNSLLDPFALITRPSVYIISDSQLAEYKRNQAEAEIAELDKLITTHENSIERLKATRAQLRTEYPQLETDTTDKSNVT